MQFKIYVSINFTENDYEDGSFAVGINLRNTLNYEDIGNLYEVKVLANKPFFISSSWQVQEWFAGLLSEEEAEAWNELCNNTYNYGGNEYLYSRDVIDSYGIEEFTAVLEKNGYDSLCWEHEGKNGKPDKWELTVFSPENVTIISPAISKKQAEAGQMLRNQVRFFGTNHCVSATASTNGEKYVRFEVHSPQPKAKENLEKILVYDIDRKGKIAYFCEQIRANRA
jgi:hypothetical protein